MRVAWRNFTGGELADTLSARYDLSRYQTSARHMENFLPNLHGDAVRRPGMRFIAELDGPSVLLPFTFNSEADQNFVLILSEGAAARFRRRAAAGCGRGHALPGGRPLCHFAQAGRGRGVSGA